MNEASTEPMLNPRLLEQVPEGAFAVGVSGGADSVALLRLCIEHRPDLGLHVVHLDHETRGAESAGDAAFVHGLAGTFGLPCTIEKRSVVEAGMKRLAANASSRYRAARLALFRRVCEEHRLMGVLLAHQADDQVETVLHRLLRGSGPAGLGGIAARTQVGTLSIWRPLLETPGAALRQYLRSIGQSWREDASNQSDVYLRNRLRKLLAVHGVLKGPLAELGERCRRLKEFARGHAPHLDDGFGTGRVAGVPEVLALESGRAYLVAQGAPAAELTPEVLQRFVAFCTDAALPARMHFPGKVLLQRKQGIVKIV